MSFNSRQNETLWGALSGRNRQIVSVFVSSLGDRQLTFKPDSAVMANRHKKQFALHRHVWPSTDRSNKNAPHTKACWNVIAWSDLPVFSTPIQKFGFRRGNLGRHHACHPKSRNRPDGTERWTNAETSTRGTGHR